MPLITAEAIAGLVAAHTRRRRGRDAGDDGARRPGGLRPRRARRRRAASSASSRRRRPATRREAELAIREVNAGLYCFDGGALLDALERLGTDNAQGELYLPDVVPAAARERRCSSRPTRSPTPTLALGVNDRVDLAHVTRLAQQRIHARAPAQRRDDRRPRVARLIDADVTIGERHRRSSPRPSCAARRAIGARCTIGPAHDADRLRARRRGRGPPLLPRRARRAATASSIGPFAYLRPGAVLRESAKAGTFVEIKNSDIGAGLEGPAPLLRRRRRRRRADANLGAGTITANYDGRAQAPHDDRRPASGSRSTRRSSRRSRVGDGAYTGAGSRDHRGRPAGRARASRARARRNIEGYAERAERMTQRSGTDGHAVGRRAYTGRAT